MSNYNQVLTSAKHLKINDIVEKDRQLFFKVIDIDNSLKAITLEDAKNGIMSTVSFDTIDMIIERYNGVAQLTIIRTQQFKLNNTLFEL